jgi:prevent-host-death family protein
MTEPPPTGSIRDVRAYPAEAVEQADRDDVPTVITRRGKEVAAVVSIDMPRKYQRWEEHEINRIIDERMANPAVGTPIEDVMEVDVPSPRPGRLIRGLVTRHVRDRLLRELDERLHLRQVAHNLLRRHSGGL